MILYQHKQSEKTIAIHYIIQLDLKFFNIKLLNKLLNCSFISVAKAFFSMTDCAVRQRYSLEFFSSMILESQFSTIVCDFKHCAT